MPPKCAARSAGLGSTTEHFPAPSFSSSEIPLENYLVICDIYFSSSSFNSHLRLISTQPAGQRQPRGCGHVRALREHRRLGDVDVAAHFPHLQPCLLAGLPGRKLKSVEVLRLPFSDFYLVVPLSARMWCKLGRVGLSMELQNRSQQNLVSNHHSHPEL